MQLEVDADIGAASRLLAGIGDRLSQPDRLLGAVGDDLLDYVREAFETEGFGQWAPLDPATLLLKGGSRILVDTGGLLDDLTGSPAVAGESVTVESDKEYAGYLKAGARGAPKRDPLPQPEGDHLRRWSEHLLAEIVPGLR